MAKFKVGDRVVVTYKDARQFGQPGRIRDEHDSPWVTFDDDNFNNHYNSAFGSVAAILEQHLVLESIYNSKLYKLLQEKA